MSGLKGYFAWKQEASYGVPVVPTEATEILPGEAIQAAPEFAQSQAVRRGRMAPNADRRTKTSEAAAGNSPMEIPTKGFARFLALLKDGPVPAGTEEPAGSGAFRRTFLDGRPHWDQKSVTLVVGRPTTDGQTRPFTYPGTMLGGYTVNIPAGAEFCTFTPEWDAREERVDIPEPPALTYPEDLGGFIVEQAVLLVDGVEPAALIRSGSWTVQRPMDTGRRGFNTQGRKRKPLANGPWGGTAQYTADFEDLSLVNAAKERNRIHIVEITLQGVEEIAPGVVPEVVARMCVGYNAAVSPNIGSAETLTQELNYTILDRDTVPAPIEYEVLSAETTVTP
jgi:hypothetical protein